MTATPLLRARAAWPVLALIMAGSAMTATGVGAASRPRVGAEVPVSATNLLVRPANNSPQFAVDPTNSRFVATVNRVDNPDFSCAFHLSGNGGRSWMPARFFSELPAGAEKCYGPEVAFDASGRMYVSFVGLKGEGNRPVGVYLTATRDRGRTWDKPRRVLGALRFQVRLAIDHESGRIHLVWLEASADPPLGGFAPVPNPIMAAYSDDGGRHFSRPVQVSDQSRARVVAPALALGAEGEVHVGYWDLGEDARDYQGLEGPVWDQPWTVVVASSSDGGRRFGRGRVVDDQVAPPGRVMLVYTMPPVSLAADDAQSVYVAWHDARNGDWDVFVAASGDGGRTWGQASRVNDDRLGNGRHQYLPRLAVAPGGRLDAIFYDRRHDADNVGNDVYYTYSYNRARSFAPNLRLTTFNVDSRVGATYANPSAAGLFDFGARLALISERSGALAGWTDTRNTTALGRPGQDLYAVEVAFPSASNDSVRSAIAIAIAIGSGVVAVAVLGTVRRRRRRQSHRDVAPEGP